MGLCNPSQKIQARHQFFKGEIGNLKGSLTPPLSFTKLRKSFILYNNLTQKSIVDDMIGSSPKSYREIYSKELACWKI